MRQNGCELAVRAFWQPFLADFLRALSRVYKKGGAARGSANMRFALAAPVA
jgi:hypothetical protein